MLYAKIRQAKGQEIRSKYNFGKKTLLLHNKTYPNGSNLLKFHGVVSFISF